MSITEHEEIVRFIENFNVSFADFNAYLKTELLEQVEQVNIKREQTLLSDDIFKRLENIPLVDKYEAYQILDDHWTAIAEDLEVIQTEGFKVTKQVDAYMVLKKQKGKEVEVQEGWKGHVLPFELVQETYLKAELEVLKVKVPKKEIKEATEKLHLKTKETIENLSDEQVYELLERKWISPLTEALSKLPSVLIANLTNKLEVLAQKYETTLKEIEDEMKETQKELSAMVDDLEGNEWDMKGLEAFQELLGVK